MASIHATLTKDTAAAAESLATMLQKEQAVYQCGNYLRADSDSLVSEADRTKIVDWCYGVVDNCQFDRENVATAMGLVDRFLSTSGRMARDAVRDRRLYQLVALASLYTSIKTREKVALGSDCLAALSHGTYTVDEIECMELTVLHGLKWRLNAPTSVQIAHHILSLALPRVVVPERTWAFILDEVRFQTEHAVRDYYLSTQRPSTVALGAIFHTLDRVHKRVRRAILGALLPYMNDEFAPPKLLLRAKLRLKDIVYGSDQEDTDTVVSREESLKREAEVSFDQDESHRKSPRRSPPHSARRITHCAQDFCSKKCS